ncbi:MAG: hypothetical protein ACOY3I_03975 [Verrucomicrobiota bacterium]
MNQLLRAGMVFALVWSGISAFRAALNRIEEEELARHGAGESDYQRQHVEKSKKIAAQGD